MTPPLKLETIGNVTNVKADKANDYIKIDLYTKDGKASSLVAEYCEFCKWVKNRINSKGKDEDALIFEEFVHDFLKESKEEIKEIIDDEGNIMPSTDLPSNADNSGIGSSKFDLDKVYQQAIPRNLRFYSGGFGLGFITW